MTNGAAVIQPEILSHRFLVEQRTQIRNVDVFLTIVRISSPFRRLKNSVH
jgi:hypothetical protein